MLGTPVKTFCDHGVKFGVKYKESKCWCRLGRFLPEEKVCAGRGIFRLKWTHYAGKGGMCRKSEVVSPKYPRSISQVSPKYPARKGEGVEECLGF